MDLAAYNTKFHDAVSVTYEKNADGTYKRITTILDPAWEVVVMDTPWGRDEVIRKIDGA